MERKDLSTLFEVAKVSVNMEQLSHSIKNSVSHLLMNIHHKRSHQNICLVSQIYLHKKLNLVFTLGAN